MNISNLKRFIEVQNYKYQDALQEIKNGHKETHWMWYIFPQIIGLGKTEVSEYYSITSLDEAKEYLENEILSKRLKEITTELLKLDETNPEKIFGSLDSLKLKSSMTLFDYVSSDDIYNKVLEKYYNGKKDQLTLEICNNMSKRSIKKGDKMEYNLNELDIKIESKLSYSDGVVFTYNNKKYYYKRVKYLKNCYNELIAEKIANRLGIPCCKYYLASYNGDIGVMSEMFDHKNYLTMEKYLKHHYQYDDVDERNTLTDIWNAFEVDFKREDVERLMDDLVNIFMFDAIIGNIDRHNENYGLIIENNIPKFAPLFDNENMLTDASIYDGDYSLGIDSLEFKKDDVYRYLRKNLLYKFLDISDQLYKDRLKSFSKVISEESLKEIFTELENDNIHIEESIKKDILNRFSNNRNMINLYLQKQYTKAMK